MSRTESSFSETLAAWIAARGFSYQHAADRLGVPYDTLYSWLPNKARHRKCCAERAYLNLMLSIDKEDGCSIDL